MKTNDLVVFFRLNDVERPVIKLIDREHQAVLAFIHMEGAHVTVHAQSKDRWVTMWDKRYSSIWSENRVAIAQNLEYRDPNKHAHYPLQRPSGPPEIPLCSVLVDLPSIVHHTPSRYRKNFTVVDAPSEVFYATIYFSKEHGIDGVAGVVVFPVAVGYFFLDVSATFGEETEQT